MKIFLCLFGAILHKMKMYLRPLKLESAPYEKNPRHISALLTGKHYYAVDILADWVGGVQHGITPPSYIIWLLAFQNFT